MTTTAPSMSSPTSSICDYCLESNLEFYEPSRDCEAAARVLVTLLGNKSPDMDSLVGYLRSFGGSDVPDWQAFNWFFCALDCDNALLNEKLIYQPQLECDKQICAVWEWDGNADIVGVGMMVVYAMGAILSTMPLLKNGILDAIRNMFYHSFGAFHSGLGLLTASVLVATLIIAGQKESVYDIETSFLCSATLTAMFFLTLPAYLDIEQRYGSGVFFGFVNWLLFIISMSMKTTAAREAKKVKDDEPFSFEAFCWDKQVSDEGATVTIIALSMVPLCVFLLAGLNAAVAHWMKRPKESVPVLGWLFFRIPWRLAYALYFFVFMWASLGSLFKLKSEISKLNDGGEAKSEERWGFGQILALATWLPEFEEAIMVTYKNVRYANQRRMNGHFVGVEKPVEEESVCLVEQTPQSYAKIETAKRSSLARGQMTF
ncbi:Pumilio-like protein 4 [Verticillium dahliae VDG2]|nr:Pumilio-like protein 4 [Verticillium dahliae VDG2]